MALSGKRCSFYNDLDSLRCCFDDLDPGRSGYIGYEELTKLVKNMPNTEDSVVPELMEKLDRDKDGKVSYARIVGVASFYLNTHTLCVFSCAGEL